MLKTVETIPSEAAALGIGLVMAGSGDTEKVQELIQFAQETDKERIQRSISEAIAIIMFRQEEKADGIID